MRVGNDTLGRKLRSERQKSKAKIRWSATMNKLYLYIKLRQEVIKTSKSRKVSSAKQKIQKKLHPIGSK